MSSHPVSLFKRITSAAAGCLIAGAALLHGEAARAQELALLVNGDPVTTVDIEQRMKLLRALHRPASRDAAVESMISDRLKTREAQHLGINIGDDELSEEAQILGRKMKLSPNQLLADITRAGVSDTHARNFLRAELGYYVLMRALNRGVEASEVAVRQEMAKEKGKGGITSYTIRQVVFTSGVGASTEALNASLKQAEALRTRFDNCDSGIPYAKTLPGVAVRPPLTRTADQLPEGFKDVLEKTPVGHLTQPSRSPNGIEVVALCKKTSEADEEDLRKTVSDRILAAHIEAVTAAKYKEMRARAVIERR